MYQLISTEKDVRVTITGQAGVELFAWEEMVHGKWLELSSRTVCDELGRVELVDPMCLAVSDWFVAPGYGEAFIVSAPSRSVHEHDALVTVLDTEPGRNRVLNLSAGIPVAREMPQA